MGTLAYYREPGQTDLEHLRSELEGDGLKIIDGATKDNAFYGAVHFTRGDADYIFGLVVQMTRYRTPDGMNFSRKEIEESMGPFQYQCPERILDLLSPIEDIYGPEDPEARYCPASNAREWRERCREQIVKAKARPRVRKGDTIKLAEPFTFADGVKADTFTLEDGRRNRWRRNGGTLVRLPRKDRWPDFQVIEPEAA